VHINFILEMLY